MLERFRVHYKFKFLIKIKNINGSVEISKITPVFTQLGLEDGANIDDLVKEYLSVYSSSYDIFWRFSEFYIILDLIIWRSSNMHSTVQIRPWTISTLLLDYLNATNNLTFKPFFFINSDLLSINYSLLKRQTKRYNFSLYVANQLSWTPEWGYIWNFKKFIMGHTTVKGSFLTYLKHFEMLGRKINFRRKIQKKKFEEYT